MPSDRIGKITIDYMGRMCKYIGPDISPRVPGAWDNIGIIRQETGIP
jgi:hypothetical protein